MNIVNVPSDPHFLPPEIEGRRFSTMKGNKMTIARTYYGDKAEPEGLECGDDMKPYDGWMFVKRRDGTIEHVKTAKTLHDDELEGLAFGKWYDISTAPRDGTEFLGWDGTDFEICIDFFGKDGWIRRGDLDYCCFEPTHWMPLPPPPREAKDD